MYIHQPSHNQTKPITIKYIYARHIMHFLCLIQIVILLISLWPFSGVPTLPKFLKQNMLTSCTVYSRNIEQCTDIQPGRTFL